MIYEGIELYNVHELEPADDGGAGQKMSRIPGELRSKLNSGAQGTAFNGCGCEIRFRMLSDEVRLVLRRQKAPGILSHGLAEVYFGSFQATYLQTPLFIGFEPTELVIRKPGRIEQLGKLSRERKHSYDPEVVRVILPFDWQTLLISVEGPTAPPLPTQTPASKLLVYGSSISHGGDSVFPTGTYAMRLAQQLGYDLVNLGFAGSAHLEPELAGYIAERKDWNAGLFELGVNVISTWETGRFASAVDQFIDKLAEGQDGRWMFCTDVYAMYMDLEGNPKLEEFRKIVRDKVNSVNLPRLVYVPGSELLSVMKDGAKDRSAYLAADLLHPSNMGMENLAANWARLLKSKMPE